MEMLQGGRAAFKLEGGKTDILKTPGSQTDMDCEVGHSLFRGALGVS